MKPPTAFTLITLKSNTTKQSRLKGAHAHFLADFNYPNFLPWSVFLCKCLAFVIHLPKDEGLASAPLSKLGLDFRFNRPTGQAWSSA